MPAPLEVHYVVGVSGAGKTHIGEQLSAAYVQVRGGKLFRRNVPYVHIRGDALVRRMAEHACPLVKPEHCWKAALWETLLKHADVHRAMRRTLKQFYPELAICAGPLLVEGWLFCLSGWREAFARSLREMGREISLERVYRLCPGVTTVMRQRLQRDPNDQRTLKEIHYEGKSVTRHMTGVPHLQISSERLLHLLTYRSGQVAYVSEIPRVEL